MVSCTFESNDANANGNLISKGKAETVTNDPFDLKIPFMGTFSLKSMEVDSLREYGAGDCWGKIIRFSDQYQSVAIDTMNCGEYGYAYTYYHFDQNNKLLTVFQKKLELSYDSAKKSYCFSRQEKLFDFNSEHPYFLFRSDTTITFTSEEMEEPFETVIIENTKESQKTWKSNYQKIWEFEFLED